MAIGQEKYVALTTYRKDGTPKSLPVWIVDLDDGKVGFTTQSTSWKVKRIGNDNRVQLQPSDGRGKVRDGTAAVDGTAVMVGDGEFEKVLGAVKAKYGYQFHIMTAVSKVRSLLGKGPVNDCAMVITLNG